MIGMPKTSSRTLTGSGVVSSATTCPGRVTTTFAFPVSTAAAERT
ncbi:hypothetical protein [Streptomyces sp. NPDC004008]